MKRKKLWVAGFLFLQAACSPITSISPPDESKNEDSLFESKDFLRIIDIDVGQGDSTLIIGPNGKKMLIDSGPPTAGEQHILPLLAEEGMSSIDWMVSTHYDADHIGGLTEVVAGPDHRLHTEDDLMPIRGFVDRGDGTNKNTITYQNYLEVADGHRTKPSPGDSFSLGNDATAEVFVVNGTFSNGEQVHLNPDEENESSIGLIIRYGNFSYVTAGDLTGGGSSWGETKDLESVAGAILGDIDILHVSHHGSRTSTSEEYLDWLQPEEVMISTGENDYGHPSDEVLERLEERGINAHRTDLEGNLEILTDGENYTIRSLTRPGDDAEY